MEPRNSQVSSSLVRGIERLETTDEVASVLEAVAKKLRSLPSAGLYGNHLGSPEHTPDRKARPKGPPVDLPSLSREVPQMSRVVAEETLGSLTVPSLRELAPLLNIRAPSRATKPELVQLLLSQLFDVPEGQQLISTYHRRRQGTRRSIGDQQPVAEDSS